MRHRITYLKRPNVDFDPDAISITKNGITLHGLRASKEHRTTMGLDEVPQELKRLLEYTDELHLRWASSASYEARPPYASRLPPGLHVIYSPGKDAPEALVSPALQEFFGLELKSSNDSKVASIPRPPASARFARSTSRQFYGYLSSLDKFADYIKQNICSASDEYCHRWGHGVRSSSSLDIDFDVASQALTVSSIWPEFVAGNSWNETTARGVKADTVEVGVLSEERATSTGDIKLGGWLTVLGQDTKPKSTLFSFPSRHHTIAGAHFESSFAIPIGLHPTLRLSLSIPTSADPTRHYPTCSLHTYLTLPPQVFLDRYAFTDALFLESHNLAALRTISGATDLEAPDWAVKAWGTSALLEIRQQDNKIRDFDVTVPLHSRYLSPAPGGQAEISVPYPVIFYACKTTEEDSPPLSTNPFDRTNVGYDGLFDERTVFYQVNPVPHRAVQSEKRALSGDSLVLNLPIPVLDTGKAKLVESLTMLVIVVGSLWIAWKLFKPLREGKNEAARTDCKKDR